MSLKKEFVRDGQPPDHWLDHHGVRWLVRNNRQGRTEHIIGRTSEQFRHDPRRTWQVGFDQHRRPRSLDRQKQVVAESVAQPPPVCSTLGGYLSTRSTMPTDAIECPLCLGEGKLKRTEVLDRLGVKDFARVAQLSAEEAFRLLLEKHKEDRAAHLAPLRGRNPTCSIGTRRQTSV